MDMPRSRYFISLQGFEGPEEGGTVIMTEWLDMTTLAFIRPDGTCAPIRYNRNQVLGLLLAGLWCELDAPDHEGGTIIKYYNNERVSYEAT